MGQLSPKIVSRFEVELQSVKTKALGMGGLAIRQFGDALQAFLDGESANAEQVLSREQTINALELELDDDVARFIARRHPAARDLRMILVLAKIAQDLERVADEAKKVARLAIRVSEEGRSPRGVIELRNIASVVESMLENALDAVVRGDNELALEVIYRDAVVDDLYQSTTDMLVKFMTLEPQHVARVTDLLWVFRAMERIGDHATNIAKYVFYVSLGEDLRHMPPATVEGLVCNWEAQLG